MFPRLARKERAREKIQKQLPEHFGEKFSCAEQKKLKITPVEADGSSRLASRFIICVTLRGITRHRQLFSPTGVNDLSDKLLSGLGKSDAD